MVAKGQPGVLEIKVKSDLLLSFRIKMVVIFCNKLLQENCNIVSGFVSIYAAATLLQLSH